MELYSLTALGHRLAHSRRNPPTPEWAVIHHLARHGVATKAEIFEYVPSATITTLVKLKMKQVIYEQAGVNV